MYVLLSFLWRYCSLSPFLYDCKNFNFLVVYCYHAGVVVCVVVVVVVVRILLVFAL